MPDEIKDMGDSNTGETSPESSSSEEEQPGIELQEIVPDASVSGEIRQPPPDDGSNLSIEEAMHRRNLPLQRSLESVSSESLQPDEQLLSDTTDYSFKNAKLAFRRGSSSKSPEEETDEAGVGDSMTELSAGPGPSGYCSKNDQKENVSPVSKMVEKCSKAVSEMASGIGSSLRSCIRPPLSEQNSSACLEDGNELDSTMDVASSGSFQNEYSLSDSTEYSFSNTKLVLRRGSSTSMSPEKKTDEVRVEDSVTELSESQKSSGNCGKNVRENESLVTKVVEKCTKAVEELASEIKSLRSCAIPSHSEQNSSAIITDALKKEDSAMEVNSLGSLQQDELLSDSTEYSFSNTKLALRRGSSISPEKETDEAGVGDAQTEMALRPGASAYCDKTQQEENESLVTKVVEKCSEALEELASGVKSSLSSCTRPPLSEQNSSASLADVSENEFDSTMEVDSLRIQPDDPVTDTKESGNTKSVFQRGPSTSESQEEKTAVITVEDSMNELSGRPGPSGYCGNIQKNESPVVKMTFWIEKCSKVAGEITSGIKSLSSGTKPPPLSMQKSSSSSFADVSEHESDSSTEVARKYRKLLNKRKVCITQSVLESHEQTQTRRKRLHRQANVEEGVEMETIAMDSSGLPEKSETSTQEIQTDTAKEIFYRDLCLLSDSDFSTSKETENDDTEDTTE